MRDKDRMMLDQLIEHLRYAEKMRDEYAGRTDSIYPRLHADWLKYIEAQKLRILNHGGTP